ncbi:MAG: TrkA C-terminal domain-containing protein [Acidimicrobiales bacterium]
MPLLANVRVTNAMSPARLVLSDDVAPSIARREMKDNGVPGAPVVDREGQFEGSVGLDVLKEVEDGGARELSSYLDPSTPSVREYATLDVALESLVGAGQRWIPVLDDDRRVLGTIAISDIVRGYRLGLLESLSTNVEGDDTNIYDVTVPANSPLVGLSFRGVSLPKDVVVTAIFRSRDLIIPTGDTVFESDDRLTLIGQSESVRALKEHSVVRAIPRREH